VSFSFPVCPHKGYLILIFSQLSWLGHFEKRCGCLSYNQQRRAPVPFVGEAAAGKSAQESPLAADGVPRELRGSAPRRAVVGRHHSAVCRRLLRRNDTWLGQDTTIYST